MKISRSGEAATVRREAVTLARIRHRGLLQVYETGEVDGIPYLVMELVRGETLADRLARGALPEAEVRRLATELSQTLDLVHRRGWVHRDIKPSNILLETGTDRVVLLDFGYAVSAERAAGATAGTPAYAAPEQLDDEATTDARADLYALGGVLFECLTGKRLHVGGAPLDRDASMRRLREAGASVGLRELIVDLTDPDPERRYASAAAVIHDLRRIDAGEPRLGPPGARPTDDSRLPLVGRADQLGTLERAWAGVSSGGGTILLRGPPGVGKTKLLSSLTAQIPATHCLTARCASSAPAPLDVLRQLFDGHLAKLGALPEEQRAQALAGLQHAAQDDLAGLLAIISPELGRIFGAAPSTLSRSLHETFVLGIAEFLRRFIAARAPTLIAIDDLQWIDPVSRDVLMFLARSAPKLPLLFVGTVRNDAEGAETVSRFQGFFGATKLSVMNVRPLSSAEIEELVRAHLNATTLPPRLLAHVLALSDGTALTTLEVLESFCEEGALTPDWGTWRFDATAAERMQLPRGSARILKKRLEVISSEARRALEGAAVLGTTFELDVLAITVDLSPEDLARALRECHGAQLVASVDSLRSRFVHDRIREVLLSGLSEDELRTHHLRAARALDARAAHEFPAIYAVADHYAAAGEDADDAHMWIATRRAAEHAFDRFDHESALRFFSVTLAAAERHGITLDANFHRMHGEALLRVGALPPSREAFVRAWHAARDRNDSASLLARIAWVEHMLDQPERAWATLTEAFALVGRRPPDEGLRSLTDTALAFGRAGLLRRTSLPRRPQETRELEITCELLYQTARLALEQGKPIRFLQSTFRQLEIAERLGPSSALARCYAIYGFSLTALGRSRRGQAYLDRGRAIAREVGDPVVHAYCVQLEATARFWAGDLTGGIERTRECLNRYGRWIEASEASFVALNPHITESVRGRLRHAWEWLEIANQRVQGQGAAPACFVAIGAATRGTLIALGRESEIPAYEAQLASIHGSSPTGGSFAIFTWPALIRRFTETGDLGDEFEADVRAVEDLHIDPKRAHLAFCEYYVQLAHARVHQLLRSDPSGWPRLLPKLDKALADLRAIAKVALLRAHVQLIEGYRAYFAGSIQEARQHFQKAERLGSEETAPWVLYGVARAEAHILQREGRTEAALDRARMALALAREHGSVHRARFICEEFALPSSMSASETLSLRRSSEEIRARRKRNQLDTLLQIARASNRDLNLEAQARAVIEELVQTLAAKRGLIVYAADATAPIRFHASAPGATAGEDVNAWIEGLVERANLGGERPLPADPSSLDRLGQSGLHLTTPLVTKERIVGFVHLERDPMDEAFTSDERDLMSVLAAQVLPALELTRLLEQRERLEETLRQSQKMEAIGRLAGGISHDFNNMLTVIESSIEALLDRPDLGEEAREDVLLIGDAAQRAKSMTRQLLAFSRRQTLAPADHRLNDVIVDLAPMLRRLIGEHIRVELDLDPRTYDVHIDRSFFDQAIVNLVVNARDAMPKGGVITVSTRNVHIDGSHPQGLLEGDYICVTVADTGDGISEEIRSRIFEPFFTTKAQLAGTGLGLSIVYGFASQSGGHVDLESTIGKGTKFHVYLPRSTGSHSTGTRPPIDSHVAPANATVLLVDDESMVRTSVQRILENAGYRVLAAGGANEAVELARAHGSEVSVVITDVLMPGASGPEVATTLRSILPTAKLLYMSGYTDGHLIAHGVLEPGVELLHKPFSAAELQARIRRVLESDPLRPSGDPSTSERNDHPGGPARG